MKALTVWQPWASMLVAGVKGIETRSWATHYRGPLAVHAAALTFDRVFNSLGHVRGAVAFERLCMELLQTDNLRDLPKGCIVGTVNVVACVKVPPPPLEGWAGCGVYGRTLTEDELALGGYTPGRFAWVCEDPVTFARPVPYRGRQGLWNVPAEIAEQIQEVTP